MSRTTFAGLFVASLATIFASGCAQPITLDSAQSTPDNFARAKAAGIRPVAVGSFRSSSDTRSVEARYLKDTLAVELQGAGMFDPASSAVVDGELISTHMDKTGGRLAARFVVTLGGRVVFDRELRITSTWQGDADVKREQGAIFNKLVGMLLTDPGFSNAVPR